MKTPISAKEKTELLSMEKELFEIETNFSLTLSNQFVATSFLDIKDPEQYNQEYLQKQFSSLVTSPYDPFIYNNLGNYYRFHAKQDSALYYFKICYESLTISYFNQDSARYLAFRGILKSNLGLENATQDIQRALQLNPNDSLAVSFYPLFLINNGDYKTAKEVCVRALEKEVASPLCPYIFLIMSEVMDSYLSKLQGADTNEVLRAQFRQTDYDKLMNLERIDFYAHKYKKNGSIQNARHIADLFALTLKMVFFKVNKDKTIQFEYTESEKKKLQSLEKTFRSPKTRKELNEFAIHESIAYLNFMLQRWDTAVFHLNKALQVFPENKKGEYFNTSETYDALLTIYFLQKQDSNFNQTLLRKINAKPEGRVEQQDYLVLAKHYYQSDDWKEALKWAIKAQDIQYNDFETLRFLSHLYYLDGDNFLTESMANDAVKYLQTKYQEYQIGLQFAIYYLLAGDPISAHKNIEIARQSLENDTCTLCDQLIEKYITIRRD
jgi:tetratricopeptide (TPR) repeat protein